MEYRALEPSLLNAVNITAPSFSGASPSLSAVTSLIVTIFFMLIGGAAFYRYAMSGIYRLEASENGIRKSNEAFKSATLGVLGVFLLFLLFFTFNRDLLRSDVGLSALRVKNSGTTNAVNAVVNQTVSGTSASCAPKEEVIAKLQSPGGICGGTSCTALSGCNYSQYATIIKEEAQNLGVDPKLVVTIMCKESKARADATNQNPGGTYDCGLMQVNQPGPCTSASLDPRTNIRAGISLIKQKSGAVTNSYNGIPARMGVLASYNCCAGGDQPHSTSGDCNTGSGFPFSIPKWACPINPGAGQFNMCSVKNYVCGIEACLPNVSI